MSEEAVKAILEEAHGSLLSLARRSNAVETGVASLLINSRQYCIAAKRFIVPEAKREEFANVRTVFVG